MSEPLLSIRGLTKIFGGLVAVDKVSFDVRRGEVVGLLGDNGAGKSTLIKCVSGVHHPEEGEIFFDGAQALFSTPMEARPCPRSRSRAATASMGCRVVDWTYWSS